MCEAPRDCSGACAHSHKAAQRSVALRAPQAASIAGRATCRQGRSSPGGRTTHTCSACAGRSLAPTCVCPCVCNDRALYVSATTACCKCLRNGFVAPVQQRVRKCVMGSLHIPKLTFEESRRWRVRDVSCGAGGGLFFDVGQVSWVGARPPAGPHRPDIAAVRASEARRAKRAGPPGACTAGVHNTYALRALAAAMKPRRALWVPTPRSRIIGDRRRPRCVRSGSCESSGPLRSRTWSSQRAASHGRGHGTNATTMTNSSRQRDARTSDTATMRVHRHPCLTAHQLKQQHDTTTATPVEWTRA